jgi:hypothetical protein
MPMNTSCGFINAKLNDGCCSAVVKIIIYGY